jgi:hypothetical protein
MADELHALDPAPERLTLENGVEVVFEELRAKQFFKLLRILTRGAAPILSRPDLLRTDEDTSSAEFATRLLTAVFMALPEADDEAIDFVRSMVKPAGLIEYDFRRKPSEAEKAQNEEAWIKVSEALYNPSLSDMVEIIEGVVRRESADILALGKKVASLLKLAFKTGQIPESARSLVTNFSGGSPESSTSSPPSTGGPTMSSETSPSDGSDSASPQSPSADRPSTVPVSAL